MLLEKKRIFTGAIGAFITVLFYSFSIFMEPSPHLLLEEAWGGGIGSLFSLTVGGIVGYRNFRNPNPIMLAILFAALGLVIKFVTQLATWMIMMTLFFTVLGIH